MAVGTNEQHTRVIAVIKLRDRRTVRPPDHASTRRMERIEPQAVNLRSIDEDWNSFRQRDDLELLQGSARGRPRGSQCDIRAKADNSA
jgi:hypothetical protein